MGLQMDDSTVMALNTQNLTEQKKRTPLDQRKSVYKTTTAEDEPLADAISMAVAAVSKEQEEPPPLSDYIDVDRLETLLGSFRDAKSGVVMFFYADYRVEMHWSGELTLWPRINH